MSDYIGNVKITFDNATRGVQMAVERLGLKGIFPFTKDKKVKIGHGPAINLPVIEAEFNSKEYANVGLLAGVTLLGAEYPHVHIKEDFISSNNGQEIVLKKGDMLMLDILERNIAQL